LASSGASALWIVSIACWISRRSLADFSEGVGLQQDDALAELAGEVVLAAVDLAPELVPPGGEVVDPRLDRPRPAAAAVDGERADPGVALDVRVDVLERRLVPAAPARGLPADDRAQDVVAVGDDGGAHADRLPDGALRREAAAVDDGLRLEDQDARRGRGCGLRAPGGGAVLRGAGGGGLSRWTSGH